MRTVLMAIGVLSVSLLAGCAEEEPTGFSADIRTGFMAACNEPLEDARLIADLCQCVYERTREATSFDEFSATDESLKETPEAALPDAINAIIADCFIETAEL